MEVLDGRPAGEAVDVIVRVVAAGGGHPDGRLLRLAADGTGPLQDHVAALVMASAQRALDAGQDLSALPWLRLQGGRVQGLDFLAYVRAIGRMKALPAFDGLSLETGENQLFGDAATDTVERYAAYRVGYHRGLDALRANGWRGSGYVRWADPTNRGFLGCLRGLGAMATEIGEHDEAERVQQFLLQLDPSREWA